MARRRKDRKRVEAPPPPKPTRRISDVLIARMLEEHMQESLSDIGELYQRLLGRMGAKTAKFQEYVNVSASVSANDIALDLVASIVAWRQHCEKLDIDCRPVMALIQDASSIATMMHTFHMRRKHVRQHVRSSLAVWGLRRGRCNAAEVARIMRESASV